MITKIRTVSVYTGDQETALRFYTETLRFDVRERQPIGHDGNELILTQNK